MQAPRESLFILTRIIWVEKIKPWGGDVNLGYIYFFNYYYFRGFSPHLFYLLLGEADFSCNFAQTIFRMSIASGSIYCSTRLSSISNSCLYRAVTFQREVDWPFQPRHLSRSIITLQWHKGVTRSLMLICNLPVKPPFMWRCIWGILQRNTFFACLRGGGMGGANPTMLSF